MYINYKNINYVCIYIKSKEDYVKNEISYFQYINRK